jgi:hypothetical protein
MLARNALLLKAAMVLATLAYPAAHFALHRVVGTDPWTLGGWAMYTVPRPKLAVFVPREGKLVDATSLCPTEAVDYVSRRMAFGHIADEAKLRDCLRQRGLRGKELWLAERRFEGASGRFVTAKSRLGSTL